MGTVEDEMLDRFTNSLDADLSKPLGESEGQAEPGMLQSRGGGKVSNMT